MQADKFRHRAGLEMAAYRIPNPGMEVLHIGALRKDGLPDGTGAQPTLGCFFHDKNDLVHCSAP